MVSYYNSMEVNKRRETARKISLPLLMSLLVGAIYVFSASSGDSLSSAERKLEPGRRSLSEPYDQSTTSLPAWTSTYANVWDTILPSDTPTYWYVNKGGGTTITYILAYCLGLTIANNQGQQTSNTTLGVWEVGSQSIWPNKRHYVNTRTHTKSWLDSAKSRGLLESGLADVVFTPYITYAGENFFTSSNRARGFAMFRHPTKRVEDQFYYRQHATWEGNYDTAMAAMSLAEFATSDKLIENFEVRSLLKMEATTDVTEADVAMAKEILRQKFVVGIFEWYDISVVRYEKYFGWFEEFEVLDNTTINWCHFKMIDVMDHIGTFPKVPTSEQIQDIIMTRMWADVELYHYAKNLFNEQAKLLS